MTLKCCFVITDTEFKTHLLKYTHLVGKNVDKFINNYFIIELAVPLGFCFSTGAKYIQTYVSTK